MTEYEYDEQGRMVRSVTRHLEPEFDDDTRNVLEGLALHDRQLCPGCGLHESVHNDLPGITFEDRFCDVCKSQDVYARVLAERDEDAVKKDGKGQPIKQRADAPQPADGRHVYLRPLSAAEVEERKAKNRGRADGRSPRKRQD